MNPHQPLRLFFTAALIVSLMGSLGACAGAAQKEALNASTPGAQYRLEAQNRSHAIHLKINADGFSRNQQLALDQVAQKAGWVNAQPVDVRIITNNTPEAVRAGYNVRDYLIARQVLPAHISYITSDDQPADVVSLETTEYRAVRHDCNQAWGNLTATAHNGVHSNFGCTVTANMAAQIADPRDIAAPAAETPADAGRKVTIIDKYRRGEVTASESNDDASGVVSNAIR